MRQTRSSSRLSLLKDKVNVLPLSSENSQHSLSFPQITNHKKSLNKCKTNLRKRNKENTLANPRATANAKKSTQTPKIVIDKENLVASYNSAPKKITVNGSFLKPYPVWKCPPNNDGPLCQKKKRVVVDVYDIAEDEDFREELNNKKMKVKKRKIIKNRLLPSECKGKSSKNLSVKRKLRIESNDEKVQIKKYPDISHLGKSINTEENEKFPFAYHYMTTNQEHIHNQEARNNRIQNNICKEGKLFVREKTPMKEIQLNSTSFDNFTADDSVRDLDKNEKLPLIPQLTSTPEAEVLPRTTANIIPGNSFAVRMSEIPIIPNICMNVVDSASDDEELLYSDKSDAATIGVSLFDSPPKIVPNIIQQNSGHFQKQLKLDLFIERSSQSSCIKDDLLESFDTDESNCIKDDLLESFDTDESNSNDFINNYEIGEVKIFKTPELNLDEEIMLTVTDLVQNKVRKPKKSYDNRQRIRKNISRSKKTGGIKKKTAAQIKEDELINSLNEHFSELENFEFCID